MAREETNSHLLHSVTEEEEEEEDQNPTVVKCSRSKSLPVAYVPEVSLVSTGSSTKKPRPVNPQAKNGRRLDGGIHSPEQECGLKRSEWRTLQQHYYPEGGWGWIVTLAAVSCHALSFGTQLTLNGPVFTRFGKGPYLTPIVRQREIGEKSGNNVGWTETRVHNSHPLVDLMAVPGFFALRTQRNQSHKEPPTTCAIVLY